MSKQLSTLLLRHGHQPREDDGAIEFWRIREYLRNDLGRSQQWSDEMEEYNAKRRRKHENISILYSLIRTRNSGQEIVYLRALQGHSGRNLIEPSSQDNVINSERFLRVYLSHRMCMCNQFTLHHEFRIDTRMTKIEQKTNGIHHVCGSNEQGTQRSECN